MKNSQYDIIIVGAGPSGCACAYQLSGNGLSIAVIDKDTFPRDKICGDALSSDVINQLLKMNGDLMSGFEFLNEKQVIQGINFFAPNGKNLEVEYYNKNYPKAAGYVAKRLDFDRFLFDKISDLPDVEILSGVQIENVTEHDKGIYLHHKSKRLDAKMVVGADGANSVINRKLGSNPIDKNHLAAGLRQYFENVAESNENLIEMHFIRDILPGYLWIFPLPNGQANVGLALLANERKKNRLNLREKLDDLLRSHTSLKSRFENAKALENPKGFALPLGSVKRKISGKRFLLLGDAAGLIDPFTGEGIANAIRSGRIASEHIIKVFESNRFDATLNGEYDKIIYEKMWKEFQLSHALQKMMKYPFMMNSIVSRAHKSESLRDLLTSMFNKDTIKPALLKPRFYLKMFSN